MNDVKVSERRSLSSSLGSDDEEDRTVDDLVEVDAEEQV